MFNCVLEYAIKIFQTNQEGLKLNGKHQLLFYVDDVTILGRSIHTFKKNTKALLVASKEVGLEVEDEKIKLMITSRNQNAVQNLNMMDDKSFGSVGQVKYLGRTLKCQNSIQGEIKSRLKSGNACYRSVQNLWSPSLLCKNIKIKT